MVALNHIQFIGRRLLLTYQHFYVNKVAPNARILLPSKVVCHSHEHHADWLYRRNIRTFGVCLRRLG